MFTFINKIKCRSAMLCLSVIWVLTGCQESIESMSELADAMVVPDQSVPTVDAGIGVLEFEIQDEHTLVAQPIIDVAVESLWSLSDGSILYQTDAGLVLYENGQTRELSFDGSDIIDAIRVGSQILIATDIGLRVLEDNTFVVSPLDALVSAPVRLVSIDENAFWFSDRTGIHHWRNGEVTRSMLSGRNLDGLSLYATRHAGGDELIIWEGLSARSIVLSDGLFTENVYGFNDFPTSIGLSEQGLWVLMGGRLFSLQPGEDWVYGDLPSPMESIHMQQQTAVIYLIDEMQIWRLEGSALAAVPRPDDLRAVHVQRDGGLLMLRTDSVEVLNSELTAVLTPPPPGPLSATHSVAAQLNIVDGLTDVEWRLDDVPVMQDALTFDLEPIQVTPGQHRLEFSASLPPDRSVTASINFEGPPSWEAVIEPISEGFCVNCHGDDARIQLLSHGDWVETYDLILYDVETGRMPLTAEKLTIQQVDMIRGWGAGGFPRQETP